MVQPDVRDDARHRSDHVRAVEAPAEPDLDDGQVHRRLSEVQQRQRDGGFEEAGADRFEGIADPVERARQPRVRCRGAIHTHPFVDAQEVWRGVEADAQPRCARDRGRQGCRGPLAIRPGHVDHGDRFLRVAERGKQGVHPLQARAVGGRAGCEAREGEQAALGVGHRCGEREVKGVVCVASPSRGVEGAGRRIPGAPVSFRRLHASSVAAEVGEPQPEGAGRKPVGRALGPLDEGDGVAVEQFIQSEASRLGV